MNVAVAWACALLLLPIGMEWPEELSGDDWNWIVYTFEGAGIYRVDVDVLGSWVEARTEDGSHVGERLPKWVNRALFGSEESALSVDGRGWPSPALYSVTNFEDEPVNIRGGFALPAALWELRGTSYALPFRPIWTAFAINTLFYATLLWLLIPGPFALRRLLRVRRGLCPKCAYPMGGSAVCTECGNALLPVPPAGA